MGESLGDRLSLLRYKRKMRTYEMAQIANILPSNLTAAESGNRPLPDQAITKIAEYFGLDSDDTMQLLVLSDMQGKWLRTKNDFTSEMKQFVVALFLRYVKTGLFSDADAMQLAEQMIGHMAKK